jgi:hypothetical protein
MAILGGAGNPVGGSFTGPAEALEIIGDHAYAYSGEILVDQTTPKFFDFTSGNYYFVGEIQFNYYDVVGDDDMRYELKFNGNLVQSYFVGNAKVYTSPDGVMPIIIPPYTEVEATGYNDSSTNGRKNIASIVGRIYRTRG